MEYSISVEKTAITNSISTTCKLLIEDNLHNKNKKILDYGFGKLRNTIALINAGFNVSIIDTDIQILKNKNALSNLNIDKCFSVNTIKGVPDKYDCILLSFVLNVVPDVNERVEILNNISNLLTDNGILYLEVRNNSFLKNMKHIEKFNDGFVIGNAKIRTFQKPYSIEEIEKFLYENNFECIFRKNNNGSVIVKAKKEGIKFILIHPLFLFLNRKC